MGAAKFRNLFILAAGILLASCRQQQNVSPAPRPSIRTITFHNNGRDRIQVYLIGQKEDWLLGRLEPFQTTTLRLPESSLTDGEEAVVLAVLPGWSRTLAPRTDQRAARSIAERGSFLPGEEWVFVNGQLLGPRQR